MSDQSTTGKMTVERLAAFGEAWNRGDVETLMTFMTDDCVYQASVGPEPGKTYIGKEAVRQGFEEMLAHDADSESRGGRLIVSGDFGVAEWSYVNTDGTGRKVEVRGCDLFEFEGDKIRKKDAFRKTFG